MVNAVNNSQKRWAIFLPGLYGGGAERVMLNLAEGLVRQGYAVDLVLAQAEGPYLSEVPESVKLVELKTRKLSGLRTIASLPALVRYVRHERPDALLSGLHANIVALWARRWAAIPLRVVISEHNTFSHQNWQLPGWYSRLMLRLVRRFYPWADAIIAVSEGVADDLAQIARIARDSIQVIYNPIVTPELQTKANEPLEHLWFDSGETPVVLAVGRLTAQKDFGTLIKAFAMVRRTHRARLLILGEGEERPEMETLVRRFGLEQDVRLPGFVPNPYPYMARASMFVLSSRWEGLPTVLVEALYCGAPVIATDCQSGPREILRDGRYGQLVPVGDVTSLALAIERMLDDSTPRPPCESWEPFELGTVVNEYTSILLGT
jgi:glycosyltransferase involved in cell wall biosynthesis